LTESAAMKGFEMAKDWGHVEQTATRWKLARLGWDLALALAIGAMFTGLWLAFLAWQLASPLFALLAVLLMLAAPAFAIAILVARPAAPAGVGEPPRNALVDGVHRADALLRIVALGRAHVWVVTSYVVVMWICEIGGMVSLKNLLVFMTLACIVTIVGYLAWLPRREQRLYDERAEWRRRLGEIEAGSAQFFKYAWHRK
jgi:hypothetical protein